jgi:RNA polymerase sigma factor (sigma-70 family)
MPDSDADLLGGDAGAFAAFYRRHEDAVLGFFLRRTGSAELTADLTAETFARALAGRRRFDPRRGEASAWLFGIARNLWRTSLERGRVQDDVRWRLSMQPIWLDDEALARIDALDHEPALRALEGLPEDQARAIRGRVLDEDEYGTLAERLQCSESVIRQRVSRGLRTLRDQLGREDDATA